LTAGAPEVPSFEIAVNGVSSLNPDVEEIEPQICKISQNKTFNPGILFSSYSPAKLAGNQKSDNAIVYLRQHLETGILPTESDMVIYIQKLNATCWKEIASTSKGVELFGENRRTRTCLVGY
jgi:hypothetical protein